MSAVIKPLEDPSTKAKRFVIGDRRMILGTLTQPVAKYATGGFTVTAKELGFDKTISSLRVFPNSTFKALVTTTRVSDSEWKVQFWTAVGAEVANEAETMKELECPFEAIGE